MIISALAFAIWSMFLKFLAWAYEIFVITARSGLIILLKKSISPPLSIPTSKIPKSSFLFILNKLKGTPYLLL